MLFALMVAIGLVGIGAVTMAFAKEAVMRNVGGAIALMGTGLLCIIAVMVVYYSGEKER